MSCFASSTAAVFVLSFVPLLAHGQGFGPKEIQEQWVGKSLYGSTAQGRSFTMRLSAGGNIEISGDAATDTGTWRLSDDGYCTTWKKIRAGTERCFTVQRQANGEVLVNNPDGSLSGLISKVQ